MVRSRVTSHLVIPAKAGIQICAAVESKGRIPAFAGMTIEGGHAR
jgi:hypothetical protein